MHCESNDGNDRDSGPTKWPSELTLEVYGDLLKLARRYLHNERKDHTLQATALVHEAVVKISRDSGRPYEDSVHFRAVAANAMRQILVDYAKARATGKRGGGRLRLTFHESEVSTPTETDTEPIDLLVLHEALTELSAIDERKARIVELRFFGGLNDEEVGRVVSVSRQTAQADWYSARAWLRRYLDRAGT